MARKYKDAEALLAAVLDSESDDDELDFGNEPMMEGSDECQRVRVMERTIA